MRSKKTVPDSDPFGATKRHTNTSSGNTSEINAYSIGNSDGSTPLVTTTSISFVFLKNW